MEWEPWRDISPWENVLNPHSPDDTAFCDARVLIIG